MRRHEDFATPEQVAAVAEDFRLEHHLDWTDGPDSLLVCVLRRR